MAVLVSLCVVLWIVPNFLPDRSQDPATDFSALQALVDEWYQKEATATAHPHQKTAKKETTLQVFNPNTANKNLLQAHGLADNTIRSWLSYIKKGGRFKNLQDLEKFRALSVTDLDRIRPYLVFETAQANGSSKTKNMPVADAKITYFEFDPNDVSLSELEALGVPTKTAKTWLKYSSNGGRFYKKEDIQKVYGLKKEDYSRLLPYIKIAEQAAEPIAANDIPTAYAYTKTPSIPVYIDINQASAEEWQELRGIGPTYSKRIVNFRNKLGGFYSIDQVGQTYHLPDSVFQQIKAQLRLSPIFKKIAINQADEKGLSAHPYISFQQAKLIIQYRNNHGFFASLEDLQKIYALDAAFINKVNPYLSFD